MKTLAVFTPTFNRKHTICRTLKSLLRQTSSDFYWIIIDDGSTDGTKRWVESLGPKKNISGIGFDWMGRTTNEISDSHFTIEVPSLRKDNLIIEYVYKPNGGLYTGYNVAYAIVNSELNVCIDSDDYMPDNAVEIIIDTWRIKGSNDYAGIIGLDAFITGEPIGGFFDEKLSVSRLIDIYQKKLHRGDIKSVIRTDLTKKVFPQMGFWGEKNFNPVYMQLKIDDNYPSIIINKVLCCVEYQENDSMSKAIFQQYVNSPRSFAKLRLLEMGMRNSTLMNKFRCASHYISSCLFSKDSRWLCNSPEKVITLLSIPIGILWHCFVLLKNQNLKS